MANDKRERQKANRQVKQDQIHRVQQREVFRQRFLLFTILAVLIGGAAYLFLIADPDDDNAFDPALQPDAVTTLPVDDADEAEDLVEEIDAFAPPAPGASIEGETPCPAEDGSAERTTNFAQAPPMCIDPAATYTALVSTTMGDIEIELDAAAAPATVNNFVVLARYGYYEGVPFHRIIPGFVIQGGDAVGPTLGTGNPGYRVEDELPEAGAYQIGSVAMANSGPDTNGSQFFIVTGPNGASLPPQYSLFGQVSGGIDVVEALDALGTEGAGVPSEVVTIESVTITES